MVRNRCIVAYDIVEPARWRQLYVCVKGHGERLQYSVFRCDLTPIELVHLRTEIREIIDHRVDRVMIVDLGPADGRGRHCFDFMGPYDPMPGGPVATIV